MQAQFEFFENYRNRWRTFFGREATEQECRDAWQEELREREREERQREREREERQREREERQREREREDEKKEAEAVRIIAQERSISDEARARITAAVRGNRQLALDIAAAPGQPALWEVLAQSTVPARAPAVVSLPGASAAVALPLGVKAKRYDRTLSSPTILEVSPNSDFNQLRKAVSTDFMLDANSHFNIYYFLGGRLGDPSARKKIESDADLADFFMLEEKPRPMLLVYAPRAGDMPSPPHSTVLVDVPPVIGGGGSAASVTTRTSRSSQFSHTVKEAFSYQCAACGECPALDKRGTLHAAHIFAYSKGADMSVADLAKQFELMGVNDGRNGICLCEPCHRALESGAHWYIDERTHKVHVSSALRANFPDRAAAMEGRVVNFLLSPPGKLLAHMRVAFEESKAKRAAKNGAKCPKCQQYVIGKHNCGKAPSWNSIRTPPSMD